MRKPSNRQQFGNRVRTQTVERVDWLMDHDGIPTRGQVVDVAVAVAVRIRRAQAVGAAFGMNPDPANGDVVNPQPITFLGHWDLQGLKKVAINPQILNKTRERIEWLTNDLSIPGLGDVVDVVVGLLYDIRQRQAAGAAFCISKRGDFSDGERLMFIGMLDPDPCV